MQISTINYTAWLIITCQLALYKQTRWNDLLPKENAEFYGHCHDYCRARSLFYRIHGTIPGNLQLALVDTALARGATVHYALRKRAIAEQALACLESGTTQIIVVGGGFDALALNTALANPGVRCFEVDMPDMSLHKKTCIENFLKRIPENFYALAADLSKESLSATLRANPAYDPAKPTLFIAEGLSMYLPGGAIERLLVDMRASAASSSLMFSAIENHKGRGIAKYIRDAILAVNNEFFDWGMPRGEMAEFLRKHGFEQRYQIDYAALQRPWRNDVEYEALIRQPGEYLTYAQG
jgi:methyltransferase (TIGR00027 family)